MTPDELVVEILRINPDGDVTIDVQDDMPMVSVNQGSRMPGEYALGGSIQEALEKYLVLIEEKHK